MNPLVLSACLFGLAGGPPAQSDPPVASDVPVVAPFGEPKAAPAGTPGPVVSNSAPLPPAPPDIPLEWVSKRPYRGQGWFAMRAALGGPVDGAATPPASSRVVGLGWGFEFGYRALPALGIGMGYQRMPHDQVTRTVQSNGHTYVLSDEGRLTTYDFVVLRAFVPTKLRFEPFFDLAGGLSYVSPALSRGSGGFGGHIRLGAGLDIWVAPRLALDMSLNYRMHAAGPGIGHLMHGAIGIKFHW